MLKPLIGFICMVLTVCNNVILEQIIVPELVIAIHSIVIMTTGVFSVETLATPVLTYINDRIIGSDKLIKMYRKLQMLYYIVG